MRTLLLDDAQPRLPLDPRGSLPVVYAHLAAAGHDVLAVTAERSVAGVSTQTPRRLPLGLMRRRRYLAAVDEAIRCGPDLVLAVLSPSLDLLEAIRRTQQADLPTLVYVSQLDPEASFLAGDHSTSSSVFKLGATIFREADVIIAASDDLAQTVRSRPNCLGCDLEVIPPLPAFSTEATSRSDDSTFRVLEVVASDPLPIDSHCPDGVDWHRIAAAELRSEHLSAVDLVVATHEEETTAVVADALLPTATLAGIPTLSVGNRRGRIGDLIDDQALGYVCDRDPVIIADTVAAAANDRLDSAERRELAARASDLFAPSQTLQQWADVLDDFREWPEEQTSEPPLTGRSTASRSAA